MSEAASGRRNRVAAQRQDLHHGPHAASRGLAGLIARSRALPARRGAAISRNVFPATTPPETKTPCPSTAPRDQAPVAPPPPSSPPKPAVTRRNLTGAVNQRIEAAGLRILAQKRVHMTRAQAETFYGVHRERPFFGELVEMMTAAPVVVQVLEGEDAISRYRDVMGATNPDKAAPGP